MLRVKPGEGNNLMRKYVIPNMRLGATSFLLHETYVPAVRFAAERCDDVALLLVEPGERNEYLATPAKSSKSAGSLPESARPCMCISPRTPISIRGKARGR